MKMPTTHKLLTYGVHIACAVAAFFVFWKWGQGNVLDAPQMLTPIAVIEALNIAQYPAKSAADHKHGIFDNPITNAAIQSLSTGDVGSAVSSIASAVQTAEDQQQTTDDKLPPGGNSSMGG